MSCLAMEQEPSEWEWQDGYLVSPLNSKWLVMSLVSENLLYKAVGVTAMVCVHLGREEH